ncbi:MAG: 16S rRNA (uracil(1498)-N(3))-methyltransferase [Betaproteobacteria bacterium]|nr:16S rRNA (uracil(1498)-N(3))-methyltransferase [Betaproteobacteria bacterium]
MTPRLLVDGLREPGQEIVLDEAQAHHALRVLRLRTGDPVQAFDGHGARWAAQLVTAGRDQAMVRLLAPEPALPESPLALSLVQCLSSAEHMDFTIEKAVELGVSVICPVSSARSVVRLDADRAARRLAHWQRLVVAACRQCGRDRLPLITDPQPLSRWLAGRDAQTIGWVLSPQAPASLAADAARLGPTRAELLIGPESGLSDDEIGAAAAAGLRPASLGPRVLRTETAGLAAVVVLQSVLGDLGPAQSPLATPTE